MEVTEYEFNLMDVKIDVHANKNTKTKNANGLNPKTRIRLDYHWSIETQDGDTLSGRTRTQAGANRKVRAGLRLLNIRLMRQP